MVKGEPSILQSSLQSFVDGLPTHVASHQRARHPEGVRYRHLVDLGTERRFDKPSLQAWRWSFPPSRPRSTAGHRRTLKALGDLKVIGGDEMRVGG